MSKFYTCTLMSRAIVATMTVVIMDGMHKTTAMPLMLVGPHGTSSWLELVSPNIRRWCPSSLSVSLGIAKCVGPYTSRFQGSLLHAPHTPCARTRTTKTTSLFRSFVANRNRIHTRTKHLSIKHQLGGGLAVLVVASVCLYGSVARCHFYAEHVDRSIDRRENDEDARTHGCAHAPKRFAAHFVKEPPLVAQLRHQVVEGRHVSVLARGVVDPREADVEQDRRDEQEAAEENHRTDVQFVVELFQVIQAQSQRNDWQEQLPKVPCTWLIPTRSIYRSHEPNDIVH